MYVYRDMGRVVGTVSSRVRARAHTHSHTEERNLSLTRILNGCAEARTVGTHYLDDSSPTATPEFYLLLLLLPSLSLSFYPSFFPLTSVPPSLSLFILRTLRPRWPSHSYTHPRPSVPIPPASSVAGPLLYPFSSLDALVCTLCVPSL